MRTSLSVAIIALCPIHVIAADYATTVLNDNPIGYWRLGETTGTIAFDASPNNLHGVYVGGASLGHPGGIPSDSDTSTLFDGITGYVDVGAHSALNQLTNNFTVEAWVKGRGAIASTWFVGSVSTGWGFSRPPQDAYCGCGPNDLRFTTFGIKDYDYAVGFTEDEWVHVAAVFDASNDVTFFVNGQEETTITGDFPARTNSLPLTIARNPTEAVNGFSYFSGNIDEVAIYGRSLSAEEIREHYLAATVPEPSSIILTMGWLGVFMRRWRLFAI